MVSYFRSFIQKKNNQKAFFSVLIGISLVASSISFLFIKQRAGNEIAFVNGYAITREEVQRSITKLQDFFKRYGKQDNSIDFKKKAIEIIAYEKVMEETIDSLGIKISSDFIADSLRDPRFVMTYLRSVIPPYLLDAQGNMQEKELKAFLKASGMTFAAFDALLESIVKQIILAEILGSVSYTSSAEIKEYYLKHYAYKKFAFYTKPLAEYRAQAEKVAVSEDELKQFFSAQLLLGAYHMPEKREVSMWQFNPESYGISVSPEDIKKYKEEHKTDKVTELEIRKDIINQKFKARFKREAKKALDEGTFLKFVADKKARFENKSENLPKNAYKLALHGKDVFLDAKPYSVAASGVVLEVIRIVPAHVLEFETIKQQVKKDLYKEKASALATSDLQKALKDKDFLKKLNLLEKEIVFVDGEQQKALLQKLSKQGLPVERMNAMIFQGASIEGQTQDAAYIIQLDTIDMNEKDFDQKKKSIREIVEKEAFMAAQRGWFIASLARSAKIELYNQHGTLESLELQ